MQNEKLKILQTFQMDKLRIYTRDNLTNKLNQLRVRTDKNYNGLKLIIPKIIYPEANKMQIEYKPDINKELKK